MSGRDGSERPTGDSIAAGVGASHDAGHRAIHNAIPIAETFTSIQGEGRLAGMPSFFIRVSGCNLRCAWCDTPYASWNPEGEARSIDSLVDEARRSGVRHVVLTGGEPMIFEPVTELTRRLHEAGFHITIETAGTVLRPVTCDLMSISPKRANSTPGPEHGAWLKRHEERRLNIEPLQQLIDAHPERQLKFVVARADDAAEIESLLARLRGWAKEDILLMPEGVTPPDEARRQLVLGLCLSRGWRYCHRLHIELFGHRRGT
ncbi:MAG: 7-carboxy-7-deazaguanine synthase QueE [Phycisphaerales bacterium]|nr:7-carboxy-7-deazaguanine synthase QueE [Phycisphaerales bacterium]